MFICYGNTYARIGHGLNHKMYKIQKYPPLYSLVVLCFCRFVLFIIDIFVVVLIYIHECMLWYMNGRANERGVQSLNVDCERLVQICSVVSKRLLL